MRIFRIGLAALLVAGQAAPTSAEVQGLTDFVPKLTKQDIAFAQRAAREQLEGKAPGTVVTWSNRESGNAGSVRLVRNLTWRSNACRQVVHEFNVKGEEAQRWEFVVCRMPDGAWKWPEPPKRLP